MSYSCGTRYVNAIVKSSELVSNAIAAICGDLKLYAIDVALYVVIIRLYAALSSSYSEI